MVASRKEKLCYYLYLVPAFSVFIVFIFWPTVRSFYLSLCEYKITTINSAAKFVGLQNYIKLFSDDYFWIVMKNTAVYTFFTVPVSIAAGLGLALLIHSKLVVHKTFYKVVYYIPYVSAMVAVASVFAILFMPGSQGVINQFLAKFGIDPVPFLSHNGWAMAAVIILSVWKELGYIMIIYLGGLLSISEDVYEAVSLDPISPWQRLTRITLPLLKPTTLFLFVTQMIGCFQVFTPVNIMTSGGPGYATTTLVTTLYNYGFKDFQMGKASAIAVVIFVILSVMTVIQNAVAGDD